MTGLQNHYQQFWYTFPKVYLLIDSTGTIIDFNKKASDFFQYSYLELKGLTEYKLFRQDESFAGYIKQREQSGAAIAVLNALLKNGKIESLSVTGWAFYDELADATRIVIIGDIAEHKNFGDLNSIESGISGSDSLINLMNVGVIVHGKDDKIVEFNNKAIELLFVNEGIAIDGNKLEREWELLNEQMLPIPIDELPHLVAKREKRRISGVVIGLKRNNKIKWLIVDAQPAINKNNEPIVIETLTNITKQIEFKNKLYVTQSILEQTSTEARIGSWEYFLETMKLTWSKITREIHEVDENFEPELNTAINFYEPNYSKNKILEAVNTLLSTGKSYALDLQIITAKGRLVWVRALGHAEFNEGVCYRIFGTFQDINDQKLREIMLQEKESEITEIYNTISDIVFKIAVEDIGKYKFVNVNNAFCKATGYSINQVINQYTTAIIPEPSIHLVHQKYAEAIATKMPVEWEETTIYAGVEKTGLVRVSPLFDAEGRCSFLIGNVHDVSEIKLAAKRAEESLNKLNHQKFALDQHSIVAVTDKKGDIIYVNDKFCEISGFRREELVGKNHRIINSGVHPKYFFDDLYQTIYSGKVWHGDICNKRKDGDLYWVRTTIVPFYDSDTKELSQFISIRTDITEEKANLEALKRNEEYLRTIFDYSLTAIIVADDKGNYIDANPYACSLFGISKDEMLKMNVADIKVTNHQPAKAMYQEYVKKGIDNGEFHFINKKGREVATLYQAIRIRKDFNVSIMVDITEKIIYQSKIEITQQLLEEVFNAVSDVIYVLDVEENKRLKYITINKSFEELTGLTVDDRINKYVDEVIPMPLRALEIDKYMQAINNKNSVVFESVGWYPTGKRTAIVSVTPLINHEGNCFRLVCSARDITDIIDSQHEINKLSLIARETINGAIITDINGFITWVNPAFEEITGFTIDEALGKKPGSLLQGEESDEYVIEYMHHQIKKKESFDVEILNYNKAGKKYWIRIQCQPLVGPSGQVEGFFAIETDVTKEKEIKIEKELLIKELTEKNYDLKQFTYITSHNLRAPLTNLVAISDLLVLPDNIDEHTRKLIEGFKVSTHRLNETLDDLIRILLLKESTQVELKYIKLEDTLDKVKHSLNMLIHENGAKIIANFTEAPEVLFSLAYLESIFLNLITNSLKYKSKERIPVINIQSKIVDGKVMVEFSDNGSGFDVNRVKDRVFRLYQRFHSNKDSKGIGLYLIKSQITALGGDVEVKSEVGKGTTFMLTFA